MEIQDRERRIRDSTGRSVDGRARVVLAVDPGRDKCGLAVCTTEQVLHREVLPTGELVERVRSLVSHHGVDAILVGDQTGSEPVVAALSGLGKPVRVVAERGSTLAARRRYFQDHPPRGIARLLPPGMRVPPVPYDDYVAVWLAERYLEHQGKWG
ncbi:MAG: hypothetical protein QN163_02845 [Armatimonadota bacterium]|nr:hypothetical protein [Armatimonadota bacterium]MDR5697529.1 hypothetical protein [Armatimonadota bacterium]